MLEDIKQYVKDKKEDIKDRVRTAIVIDVGINIDENEKTLWRL